MNVNDIQDFFLFTQNSSVNVDNTTWDIAAFLINSLCKVLHWAVFAIDDLIDNSFLLVFNFDFIVLVIKLFTVAPPDLFRETLLLEYAIAHFHHHGAVFDAEHEFAGFFGHVFF